ncbi:hypothetical protein JMUB7496_27270 [Staphylococcus aureus]
MKYIVINSSYDSIKNFSKVHMAPKSLVYNVLAIIANTPYGVNRKTYVTIAITSE